MPEDLASRLRASSPAEIQSVLHDLPASLDRREWGVVAEHAYLHAGDSVKDAATRYFVRCAQLYTRYLSPTFHMIPWDDSQLMDEAAFSRVFGVVAERTRGLTTVTEEIIQELLAAEPSSLVVFRMIAAYSRNQVSYLLDQHFRVSVSGDDLRVLERHGRNAPSGVLSRWQPVCTHLGRLLYLSVTGELLEIREGVETDKFRSLTDKFDTRQGWESVARASRKGVPYWALLYQRYIGSVFGLAINASTTLKGDLLEGPIEKLLTDNGIPFYRVGTRERVKGWPQAPDFFVPSKETPSVVIESKVAEDGGTARDKASRIERLAGLAYSRGIVLVSVVDGLGFFRINDVLAPILENSKGLVYSYSNLDEMLNIPELAALRGIS